MTNHLDTAKALRQRLAELGEHQDMLALDALLTLADAAEEVRQDGTSRQALAQLHAALEPLNEQQP